jgi:hypothetical protein
MRGRVRVRREGLVVLLMLFGFVRISGAQSTDERDVDRLFEEFKQALMRRTSPGGLLSPSLEASQRERETQKASRPYVSLQFKYNLAALQRTSASGAKLPLMMEWETAHETGRLTASARLEKVADRWYFSDFDFRAFPWAIIMIGCFIGVAFAVLVLYFYWRSRKRRRQTLSA